VGKPIKVRFYYKWYELHDNIKKDSNRVYDVKRVWLPVSYVNKYKSDNITQSLLSSGLDLAICEISGENLPYITTAINENLKKK
jgi:hypothetical protein